MNFGRTLAAPLVLLVVLGALAANASPPAKSIHELNWYVHPDLRDPNGSWQDIGYWRALIEEATVEANALLQGKNGPGDLPCCTALAVGTVEYFLDPASILFDIGSSAEFNSLREIGTPGSRAYFVDSITSCSSDQALAIGCGERPDCATAATSPDIILAVTLDAHEEFDRLANTLAHERGHNACLEHVAFVDASDCQLMTPASGGACLDDLATLQCDRFRAAANAAADGSCECHDSVGVAEEDATACTLETAPEGLCSGGLCGETGSDASVTLVAAAGTAAAQGDTTDEWIAMSGVTGGWSSSAPFGSGFEVRGFAYSPGRNIVYGIAPERLLSRPPPGDRVSPEEDPDWTTTNTLLELDPTTGAVSVVGTIDSYDEMVALAFDPGPTADPEDDRLLALAIEWNQARDNSQTASPELEDFYCRRLVEIDPDDASVVPGPDLDQDGNGEPPRVLSQCSYDLDEGAQGMAYDATRSKLYTSSRSASLIENEVVVRPGRQLREIELPCGTTCTVGTTIETPDTLYRRSPSLAYSATSDRLHHLGWRDHGEAGTRLYFDSFDAASVAAAAAASVPTTFDRAPTLTVEGFSAGGLAAIPIPFPVPEPLGGPLVALVALAMLGRRRSLAPGVSYSHLTTGGAVGEVTRAGEGCARRAGSPHGD
ncbi:MAG: hypothetical protein VX574_00210 [Myxococcota bacterium]|nr:hypothetical protein [Myxococcota bacterium]